MSIVTLVNLSRADAFVSVAEGGADMRFVTALAPGQAARQATAAGQSWSVVAGDSYIVPPADRNQVFLITANGVYLVESTRAVTSEGGIAIPDPDFPSIGGSAPAF